jgi:hypothetical protein
MRHRYFRLAAAALALAGYWAPWLAHRTAALRLNGYELSEWVTFLPGVRSGELPISRLLFLLPLACLALLLAIVATRVPVRVAVPSLSEAPARPAERPRTGLAAALPALAGPWAWPLLLAAVMCGLTVLPPYPYILNALGDPEFQGQFFIGCATLLGLALVGYLPAGLKDGLQVLLGLAGALLGGFALLTLHPIASALLNAPWPIGVGWAAMLAGFGALAAAGVAQVLGPRE